MNSAGRFGSGFLIGALLTGLLLMIWSPAGSESNAERSAPVATTVPETTAPPFLEPGEVLIGATALLPRDLVIDGSTVVFDYDLAGLGPTLIGDEDSQYQGEVTAFPERWVLTTESGLQVEEITGPRDTSTWFELPSEEEVVATISLIGWRVPTPFGERIELTVVEGASGSFRSGVATIETILEQSTSTIVQIDFDRAGADWHNGVPRPLDPRWRVSGTSGGGIQLIWDGADAPTEITLEDFGSGMRPIAGDILVIDERMTP